jgi:hypothetical protein
MGDGLCYCNPQSTAGGTFEHAVNCPLRPQVLVTPVQAASSLYSSETTVLAGKSGEAVGSQWQRGYDVGFAAGLAAGKKAHG